MQLDPDDIDRLADAIAERLAQRLREQPSTRFVDAATVARVLGVKRNWVYEHARELGAVRLGGAQGRLRFDLHALEERLARLPIDASPTAGKPPAPKRPPARAGRRPVPLLPYLREPRYTITQPGHDQATRRPGPGR